MSRVYCAGFLLLMGLTGCLSKEAPSDYVARVDDQYLTEAELQKALAPYTGIRDSAAARAQIIDDWITEALLYREARRRELGEQKEVQERLREARRSVLIRALVTDLKKNISQPSEIALRTYYEHHRDHLRLRQPFLRVRYLRIAHPDTARRLRMRLLEISETQKADSLWPHLAQQYAYDAERSLQLSRHYYPVKRLQRELTIDASVLQQLDTGEITPVLQIDDAYHFLQVVGRAEEGSIPELHWVRDKIIQQLLIREKKLIYAREVQRLRTRARADQLLEIH